MQLGPSNSNSNLMAWQLAGPGRLAAVVGRGTESGRVRGCCLRFNKFVVVVVVVVVVGELAACRQSTMGSPRAQ